MENRIRIGDFVKMTGCTLKAINYYHKIGLLPEPHRSAAGYRLYGPAELNRMRFIKRLKALGLDLKQIKQVAGDLQNPKTSREVLQALRCELQNEKKTLEERLAKIDSLLLEDAPQLNEDSFDSPSFQMITDIMGAEQIDKYSRTSPELYEQHRKVYGILDDFQWGEDYQGSFRILAKYFKTHPDHYQLALDLGACWEELFHVSEDDPRIETLARKSAAIVKDMPPVKELICSYQGKKKPMDSLYQDMVAGVMSPAQLKYQQLFEKYLCSENE